jgi:imidazolonepropionase-like amidohydrolase
VTVRASVSRALLISVSLVSAPLTAHAVDLPDGDAGTMLLAGRVLLPDGTLQDESVVVVQGEKIVRVAPAAEFAGQELIRFGLDTVIAPGMLDLFATPGAHGQTVEDTSAVEPDTTALTVLDPGHGDFRAALEAGITAMLVAPAATNLVNGICLTTRTHVVDGRLSLLREDGPLLLAFGEGVWRADRPPTSRAGAIHELRNLVAEARQGHAHWRIHAVMTGQLDAWIACSEEQDVVAVRHVLADAAEHFGIIHSQDALNALDALRPARQPVVVGPYTLETSRRELLGAAALSQAGLEVAFRAGLPLAHPHGSRLTAALAVRHGMDPAAARRALTSAPAQVAGVADRVGSVAPGKDADLVVFSHDLLRMDARVLAVYVLGQRVYSATRPRVFSGGVKS